ncbi:MAG: apolipoprotein N-acyltransferase, partial [Pyrinomonadaceae bacterium]
MQGTVSLDARARKERLTWRALVRILAEPTLAEWGLAGLSAALVIFSFPDFNLWPLAWVALVPLSAAVVRREPRGRRAFLLGWAAGTVFFYGSCYWLTHAMVHYGRLPPWVAYPLLVPGAMVVGLLPGLWSFALARLYARYGAGGAFLVAPFAWAALEWARLGVTGQLWNAIGYAQAYVPILIQPARWGGVYTVGFLTVAVNAAVAYVVLKRSARALVITVAVVACVALTIALSVTSGFHTDEASPEASAVVIAVQPNVAANFSRSAAETAELVNRHLTLSAGALREWDAAHGPSGDSTLRVKDAARGGGVQGEVVSPAPAEKLARVVIWPESPMNFTYAQDARFRELVTRFAREHRTSVLFNSLEPAPGGGVYNSAVMVDAQGRFVGQYDKIRLLPFGEYVPLPRWFPPAWLVSGIVGEFTPGAKYTLLPIGTGETRAGVFICFESAFPSIARTFTDGGADVLVNISNDGYLG